MSCTKNLKSFLGIKFNGSHQVEDDRVTPWGEYDWAKYEVSMKCVFCGCRFDSAIVSESKMLQDGYDAEKLHDLHKGFYKSTKDANELKPD